MVMMLGTLAPSSNNHNNSNNNSNSSNSHIQGSIHSNNNNNLSNNGNNGNNGCATVIANHNRGLIANTNSNSNSIAIANSITNSNANTNTFEIDWLVARVIVLVAYAITAFVLIARVKKCLSECKDKHVLAITIAACCVGLTIPISIYQTMEYFSAFTRPKLQSQVVRIIWMAPVFSLESLFSIVWVDHAFYFQSFREIYEAFVIYSFMRFLLHYLGDEIRLAQRLSSLPSSFGKHSAPFCCMASWSMGKEFLKRCKACVFQYILVRFTTTTLAIPLHLLGWYHEGDYSLTSWYLWSLVVNSCSQALALYALLMFYHSSQKDLVSVRPFSKFISIKLIIFFSYWQSLGITVLVSLGHINEAHGHSVQEVAALIEDLLVCMEMFVAAVGFLHAFPVAEYYYALDLSELGPFSVASGAQSLVNSAQTQSPSVDGRLANAGNPILLGNRPLTALPNSTPSSTQGPVTMQFELRHSLMLAQNSSNSSPQQALSLLTAVWSRIQTVLRRDAASQPSQRGLNLDHDSDQESEATRSTSISHLGILESTPYDNDQFEIKSIELSRLPSVLEAGTECGGDDGDEERIGLLTRSHIEYRLGSNSQGTASFMFSNIAGGQTSYSSLQRVPGISQHANAINMTGPGYRASQAPPTLLARNTTSGSPRGSLNSSEKSRRFVDAVSNNLVSSSSNAHGLVGTGGHFNSTALSGGVTYPAGSNDYSVGSIPPMSGGHPATSLANTSSIHGAYDSQKTILQALWHSSVPDELRDDFVEFGTQVNEVLFQYPYIQLKRWMKGSSGRS